jgi:hypothetical protein
MIHVGKFTKTQLTGNTEIFNVSVGPSSGGEKVIAVDSDKRSGKRWRVFYLRRNEIDEMVRLLTEAKKQAGFS